MNKIALISDSCCDLTQDLLERYKVHLFPIRIIYNDKEYLDKINISAEEMYSSLTREIPTTSLPDLHYCENLIEKLVNEGFTDLIIITVSSNLSGTLNSLQILSKHYPNINFHFFDSKTLGYPQGIIALETAKLIQNGLPSTSIINKLSEIRKRTYGYIAPATLEFLYKGGRINKATATIGGMLNLKPIISYNDAGALYIYAKVRGQKQAYSKLKSILSEHLSKASCKVWILHGDALESAQEFYESIKDLPNITSISLEVIGPSMGIHTGPGVIGFALIEE